MTLKTLADSLSTKAWSGLTKNDSALAKLLTSAFFKDESKGHSADQIDHTSLMLFGILHCRDSKNNKEKAKGLYEVLQDGGFERHTHISAGDKDFKPTFEKMCSLVTYDLWEFASARVPNQYSEGDADAIKEIIEDEAEDGIQEIIYGPASTKTNEEWLERIMSKEARFMFDAAELRARLHTRSQVEAKHMN